MLKSYVREPIEADLRDGGLRFRNLMREGSKDHEVGSSSFLIFNFGGFYGADLGCIRGALVVQKMSAK